MKHLSSMHVWSEMRAKFIEMSSIFSQALMRSRNLRENARYIPYEVMCEI